MKSIKQIIHLKPSKISKKLFGPLWFLHNIRAHHDDSTTSGFTPTKVSISRHIFPSTMLHLKLVELRSETSKIELHKNHFKNSPNVTLSLELSESSSPTAGITGAASCLAKQRSQNKWLERDIITFNSDSLHIMIQIRNNFIMAFDILLNCPLNETESDC